MEGIILIYEYAGKFRIEYPSNHYKHYGLYKDFDSYLVENKVELEDAFDYIKAFVNTKRLADNTAKSYQRILRKFVEFVFALEKVELHAEAPVQEDNNGTVYLLHRDGSYELINDGS